MYRSIFVFIFALFFCSVAFGDSVVESAFEDRFANHYEDRFCGKNITNFLNDLENRGVSVEDFSIVEITNIGFTTFGMVNAEAVRGVRFGRPTVTEQNWHFHVIAVDKHGYVYDFSYQTIPSIVPFETYIETMFLNEQECQGSPITGEFCVGKSKKLKDYRFKWSRLLSGSDREILFDGSMDESLNEKPWQDLN